MRMLKTHESRRVFPGGGNTLRSLLFGLAVVAMLVLGFWGLGYHSSEFRGGIGIQDSGLFSYPRYHVQIGEVPLSRNGQYLFAVRGLPPCAMDLALQIKGANSAEADQLTSLATSVSVSITDVSGKIVCFGGGSLSNSTRRGLRSWTLTSSGSGASFWHPACQQLPMSRHKSYVVKVSVLGTDQLSSKYVLLPLLQGGGVELP